MKSELNDYCFYFHHGYFHLLSSYFVAGPPFGSVMYQFVGMRPPFIVLTVIAALGGGTAGTLKREVVFFYSGFILV